MLVKSSFAQYNIDIAIGTGHWVFQAKASFEEDVAPFFVRKTPASLLVGKRNSPHDHYHLHGFSTRNLSNGAA
jgi:hypothetical protein